MEYGIPFVKTHLGIVGQACKNSQPGRTRWNQISLCRCWMPDLDSQHEFLSRMINFPRRVAVELDCTTCYRENLTSTSIRRTSLIWDPYIFRSASSWIENIDWYSPPWIPVAADSKPHRIQLLDKPCSNSHCACFMKVPMVSKAGEEKLQGLRFNQPIPRYIIDHEMGKIRLTSHGAERGKFWACKTRHIWYVLVCVCNSFQNSCVRRWRGLRAPS